MESTERVTFELFHPAKIRKIPRALSDSNRQLHPRCERLPSKRRRGRLGPRAGNPKRQLPNCHKEKVLSKQRGWHQFTKGRTRSSTRAFQGSILGSGFWYVRTLCGLGGWPNVIFVEFLARHMVRPVSSLGASSQFPPPPRSGYLRVVYLALASGMCGPSLSSGGGPSCIFNASGGESAFQVDLESTYAVEVDSCIDFVVLSCDFTGMNNGQLSVLPTLPRFHKRISAKTCICAGLDALALLRPHSANRLERTNASCAAHCTAWRRSVLHLGACELPEALDRRRALAGSDTFSESNYKSLSLSRSWTETVPS